MVKNKHEVQIEVIKEMKKQLEDLENHIYNNKDEFELPESFVDVFRERQNNLISKWNICHWKKKFKKLISFIDGFKLNNDFYF